MATPSPTAPTPAPTATESLPVPPSDAAPSENGLDALRQANEAELTRIKQLQEQETFHRQRGAAAQEAEAKAREMQMRRDESLTKKHAQEEHLAALNKKLANSDKATQIMSQITQITDQNQATVRELREKLKAASTTEATQGAEAAQSAQHATIRQTELTLQSLKSRLASTLSCKKCDAKSRNTNANELRQQIAASQKQLNQQKGEEKSIEVAAKDSVKKAASARMDNLQKEMDAARKKLAVLEAAKDGGPNTLNSKDGVVASAAAHEEVKQAIEVKAKEDAKLQNAKDIMAQIIERLVASEDKAAVQKATDAANGQGQKVVGRIEGKLDSAKHRYAAEKKGVEIDAKSMKAKALQAAADNDLALIASVQGRTAKALAEMHRTQMQMTEDQQALSEAEEWSTMETVHATSDAKKKVADHIAHAKQLAQQETTPQLDQRISDATEAQESAHNAIMEAEGSLKSDMHSIGVHTVTAAEEAAEAEGRMLKKGKQKAAQDHEEALKQQASGVSSPDQAQKMAKKMDKIKDELEQADEAIQHSKVKADGTKQAVESLVDQSMVPENDLASLVQKMLTLVSQKISDVASLTSRSGAIALKPAAKEKLGIAVGNLRTEESQMEDHVEVLKNQMRRLDEAKLKEAKGHLAMQFRSSIEKVTKAGRADNEGSNKVKAAKELLLKTEQKYAVEEGKQWQKKAYRKIAGPGIGALKKERAEIDTKLQLAGHQEQQATSTIHKMQSAAEKVTEDESTTNRLLKAVEKQQAVVDALPTGDSPERVHELEKLDKLTKQMTEAEKAAIQAKRQSKAADTLSPQLKAAGIAIDKIHRKIYNLMLRKSELSSVLGTKETAMKRADAGTNTYTQKEATEKLVETKEGLQKVEEHYKQAEDELENAQDEKAAIMRTIKRADNDLANEKVEKVDGKNEWVREMVHYAQKEKAFKKFGTEASQKHAVDLKRHNDEKEKRYKREVTTKNEKVSKTQEVKNKAEKRKVELEKAKSKHAKEKADKKQEEEDEKQKKVEIAGEIKNKASAEAKFKSDSAKEADNKREAKKQNELLMKNKAVTAVAEKNAADVYYQQMDAVYKNSQKALNTYTGQPFLPNSTVSWPDRKEALDVQIRTGATAAQKTAAQTTLTMLTTAYDAGRSERKVKEETANTEMVKAKSDLIKAGEKVTATQNAATQAQVDYASADQIIQDREVQEAKEKRDAATLREAALTREHGTKLWAQKTIERARKLKAVARVSTAGFKQMETLSKDYKDKFTENRNKYVKFDQARSAIAQRDALRAYAEAQSVLSKDETLFKEAKTGEEEREYGNQLTEDKIVMKRKRAVVDADGKGVQKENARKKAEQAKEEKTTNMLKLAETKLDIAVKSREHEQKVHKKYKARADELYGKKDKSQDAKETAEKWRTRTEKSVKDATTKVRSDEAKTHLANAETRLTELTQKFAKATTKADTSGKDAKNNALEAGVKVKQAQALCDKGNENVQEAVLAMNAEVKAKLATRTRLATERHLKTKEASDLAVAQMKALVEKSMKKISTAHTPKMFQERLTQEKAEKKEYEGMQNKAEKLQKRGSDELARKQGDNLLFKNLMEKDRKARVWRMKARASSSEAEVAEGVKKSAIKADAKALELKTKATEKLEKAKASVPGEKESDETKDPKEEKAEEKKSEEADKKATKEEEKKDADVLPPDETAAPEKANYMSPYTALKTEMENDAVKSDKGSYHRRRRWVARRRAPGDNPPADLAIGVPDKKEKMKGFSASFWSSVRGMKTLGDAILKISSIPATKKEIVDSINYPATAGFWIGLNKNYQNNFVARFRGHINVPASGDYTFYSRCADGCMVYINGKIVVKNDGLKDDMEEQSGSVKLKPGVADVVVDYFCATGKAGLVIDWKGPGLARTKLSDKHVQAADHEEELGESLTTDELKSMRDAALAAAHVNVDALAAAHVDDLVDLGPGSSH